MSKSRKSDEEHEILAMKYDTLRRELLEEKKLGHQRATQSIAAIGVVGGYSLLSQQFIFITFIPVIISFVFVINILQINEVMLLAWKAYKIEDEIDIRGFDYERDIGVIGNDNHRDAISSWYAVPPVLLAMTILMSYIGFSVLAYYIISPNSDILGQSARTLAGGIYLTLFLFIIASTASMVKLSRYIAEQVESETSSGFIL